MMEQATNTFTKGLLTDIHPMMLTNEVLSDCLNGTVITMNGNEPALLNDMGNVRVEDANLPSGYTPVGMKEYGGVIYVAAFNPVTGKSLIGSFPSPERKKSLDDDLKAEFNFSKFETDSYYEDLNLNGTHDSNESYFLKNDSYLVPLTGSVALHVGDKFVIYSSSELSAISDKITNWNNVYEEYLETEENNEIILTLTKGIAYSPKNRKYTIQVGILNEQNEFVDITKSLVRWDGNDRISDFINDSDIYKFNKGYHIAIANSWEHIDIPDNDRQFILNRQANPINNFSYKLAGPLYLKVSYNHVLSFNYDIEGLVNGNNLELTIKGYFTYNCPDVANATTLKTVVYLYIYKGYELELQFLDNDENPAHWSANQSEIYIGPTGYEWENTKPNEDFIYISIRKKINESWGLFSEPVLFDEFILPTSSEDYYTYELAEATDINEELINYDFNITKFINAGTEQAIPTDPDPSSTYSDITYDKLSNLYSCTLTKKYVYNLSELSNIIDSKLDYEIKTYSGLTKTESESNLSYTIYLKNLCYNGTIDVSLLNSGELTLKQYKFYNKLATKDDEKNLSLLLLRFESYPKEGESRRNLKIEFRNINTSEVLTPKRLITDLKITNGVIQLPFTWEQVKEYNDSTGEWDINSYLDSRKVYDVKIYYDLYDKDDNLIEENVLYDDIATKAHIFYADFNNLTPEELATYQPCFKYDTNSISYEMTVTDYTSNPPLLKTITLVGDTWIDENLVQHTVTEILYWRTERWFLTTELFNDLYSDLSGIDDYCNKYQTDGNLLFLNKLIIDFNTIFNLKVSYNDIKYLYNTTDEGKYLFTENDDNNDEIKITITGLASLDMDIVSNNILYPNSVVYPTINSTILNNTFSDEIILKKSTEQVNVYLPLITDTISQYISNLNIYVELNDASGGSDDYLFCVTPNEITNWQWEGGINPTRNQSKDQAYNNSSVDNGLFWYYFVDNGSHDNIDSDLTYTSIPLNDFKKIYLVRYPTAMAWARDGNKAYLYPDEPNNFKYCLLGINNLQWKLFGDNNYSFFENSTDFNIFKSKQITHIKLNQSLNFYRGIAENYQITNTTKTATITIITTGGSTPDPFGNLNFNFISVSSCEKDFTYNNKLLVEEYLKYISKASFKYINIETGVYDYSKIEQTLIKDNTFLDFNSNGFPILISNRPSVELITIEALDNEAMRGTIKFPRYTS